MTTGLTEDDRRRIKELAERAAWDRGPKVLCPGEESDSEAEDGHG